MQDVYIAAAKRTPVGKAFGQFKNVRPDDLLAYVIQDLISSLPEFDLNQIADVIIGCAMPEAEQGMNVARIGALLGGLPESVPAMTINRFCSSGLQSVAIAADKIALGQADVIIAGGTESMSMVPLGGHQYRANIKYFDDDNIGIAYGMGITAELVADKWSISREQQDEFALSSHQKALKAINDNLFDAELIGIKSTIDEGPRSDTSIEALARLRPVFKNKGTVTAGNSSQRSDGAGAVLVVSESFLKQNNLQPLAKFRGFSVAGVAPEIMGIGPIEAIPKVLSLSGIRQDDLAWVELNEAFAAQSLAVIKELGLNLDIINPQGGAIALGHPLGATGAIRLATMLHGLKRNNAKYGMVTMCIGTGMGAAGVFEAI